MIKEILIKQIPFILFVFFTFFTITATAGGITLGGTRIIYPAGQKQSTISVSNTSEKNSFMVQSWVEDANGNKSQDFIVTPPLFVSGPGNENTLRLMYIGKPIRTDRETLYYYNSKSIPSIDKKSIEGKNILLVAPVTRIKLFVRPEGLTPPVESAPKELIFSRVGDSLRIENPTPYHITMSHITVGTKRLPDTMVNPKASVKLPVSIGYGNRVNFRTINDYGAATPVINALIK